MIRSAARQIGMGSLALSAFRVHGRLVLDDFIAANRSQIIALARARVASRTCLRPTVAEIDHGIPIFLDQLTEALRLQRSTDKIDHDQIVQTAGLHGRDLLHMGLTVAQVVHDYGDVCQTITGLALEQGAPISGQEFQTLNLCLDDAIAEAVTVYGRCRETAISDEGTERLGIFAHELRNLLNTAMLSFESVRSGRVPPGGSTSMLVSRSLMGLRRLIDRSLADVRLDAGIERMEPIGVAGFIEEVEIAAALQAQARGLHFAVTSVNTTVSVDGDREILAAALSNLLQNAFKFTREHGSVSLAARVAGERVLFEVEDECGGLPPGSAEELFLPFEQRGADRSGLGLGLSICVKAAKANGGELRVRDLPGKGCIFTLDLPKRPPPPLSLVDADKNRAAS